MNEWVVAVLTANPVESFVVVNVLVSLMDRKCCAGGMGGDRVSFDLPPSIAVVVAFASNCRSQRASGHLPLRVMFTLSRPMCTPTSAKIFSREKARYGLAMVAWATCQLEPQFDTVCMVKGDMRLVNVAFSDRGAY